MIKVLRTEQWSKNLVILIPTLISGEFQNFLTLKLYMIMFSFSILASSTYILNDIKDIEQDQLHPQKKFRPIAAGQIKISFARKYALTLLFLSFILINLLEQNLIKYYFLYLLITVSYSISFKYLKYLDFLSITFLFLIRIVVGGVGMGISFTNYFIYFIIFVLTTISLGKKISIFMNIDIPNKSKVKEKLLASYSQKELKYIYNLFVAASIIVFIIWLNRNLSNTIIDLPIAILSLTSLVHFFFIFYKDSSRAKTENFITWLFEIKNLLVVLIITISTLAIIY